MCWHMPFFLRYQIRYAVSSLYRRVRSVDLAATILSEAVPLAVAHAVRVTRLRKKVDSSVSFLTCR